MQWLDRSLVISPIYYCLCTTEEMYKEAVTDLGIDVDLAGPWIANDHSGACANHFEYKVDGNHKFACIICIRPGRGYPLETVYGLLVHEAMHLWRKIKENIGEDEPSSEFEAYSMQMISQELMHAYKEQTEKKVVELPPLDIVTDPLVIHNLD